MAFKAVLCGSCGVFIKREVEEGWTVEKSKQKSWGREREERDREYRRRELLHERRTEGQSE